MAKFSPFSSSIIYSGKVSTPPVPKDQNNTDTVAPEFRLYIEGVQVPFTGISISQAYGALPTASVSIPPAPGLMDIVRGYEPKVHIFYQDDNYGGLRLLFWGHIKTVSYRKDRASGSTDISFQCVHKNEVFNSFTLDYLGWAGDTGAPISDPNAANQGGGVKLDKFNSKATIVEALKGITGTATSDQELVLKNGGSPDKVVDIPTDKLPSKLADSGNRLVGMPGVLVNMWNQVKKSAMANPKSNVAFWGMWQPMVDEGISFFKRMSGHPVLEEKLQSSTEPYCLRASAKASNIITPPVFRSSAISAQQREIAAESIYTSVSFSGELTTFPELQQTLLNTCEYDLITLASPAEVPADPLVYTDNPSQESLPKVAVETIVKPRMPVYFSPVCNVILPRMFSSISIQQDEASVPTRISASVQFLPGQEAGQTAVTYRGPSPVREAVSYNNALNGGGSAYFDIGVTKGYSYSIPSTYEQGKGIHPEKVALPFWLSMIISDKAETSTSGGTEKTTSMQSDEYNQAMLLAKEWSTRYAADIFMEDDVIKITPNPAKEGLNIFNLITPSIFAYERLMYSTIDYQYTTRVASSRSGVIEGPFNPYIIPGYPMDVIDESPDNPSFHGFCTSVNHSISPMGVMTSIGMAAAMTYAELSNYRVPALPPFLMSALNLVNGTIDTAKRDSGSFGSLDPYSNVRAGIIQNPEGKKTADLFYRQVLGVGSVGVDDLLHFASGRAYKLDRVNDKLVPRVSDKTSAQPAEMAEDSTRHGTDSSGRIPDDNMSYVGNLRLVGRPIEAKESIESKFTLQFIDISPEIYNNTFINYINPILKTDFQLEPGASMFLDYMETTAFISNLNLP